MPACRHLPLLAALATALLGCGLLALAVGQGWLGPDVGRGAQFCEAARPGPVKQPANALSNAGFVLAGLLVGWEAGRLTPGRVLPGLATTYACVVVLLGPASAAMHATQSDLGGQLDMLSMYLVAGFAAACAWTRWRRRGIGTFWAWFLLAVLTCEAVARTWTGHVPVVAFSGNEAFAALLLTAAVLEVRIWRRDQRTEIGWGVAAIGAMLVAFVVWNLAQHGWCDPHSLLQGHAVWHLLCAVAAWCLWRLYASAPVPESSAVR